VGLGVGPAGAGEKEKELLVQLSGRQRGMRDRRHSRSTRRGYVSVGGSAVGMWGEKKILFEGERGETWCRKEKFIKKQREAGEAEGGWGDPGSSYREHNCPS